MYTGLLYYAKSMPKLCALFHGGNHHEGTRVLNVVLGTADGNLAVLQGLTQHFEDAARQLRQFVEEEHAVVGQRYFARLCVLTAANEGDLRNGVVRGTERALRDERRAAIQSARHRVNLGGL